MESEKMSVRIRLAEPFEIEKVNAFYQSCDYYATANPADVVCVATDEDSIIGAVRLSRENEIPVLRGMFVDKNFQRKGIGKLMLFYLEKFIPDEDCYCLPYAHLALFYGAINFVETFDLPEHLEQRLKNYLADGLNMIAMKRAAPVR
jgi:GNAT superfamily N-acetyltransferase